MATTVQARLDEETAAILKRVAKSRGWSSSQVVREGIRRLVSEEPQSAAAKLIGIGCVDFGPGDLSTNKKYMKDFGRKSMGKGWRKAKDRAQ